MTLSGQKIDLVGVISSLGQVPEQKAFTKAQLFWAINILKQESIPVGCVQPAFVVSGEGKVNPTPWVPGPQYPTSSIPCPQIPYPLDTLTPSPARKDMRPEIPYPMWTEWLTDTWRHYLPATTFAGGNELYFGLKLLRDILGAGVTVQRFVHTHIICPYLACSSVLTDESWKIIWEWRCSLCHYFNIYQVVF